MKGYLRCSLVGYVAQVNNLYHKLFLYEIQLKINELHNLWGGSSFLERWLLLSQVCWVEWILSGLGHGSSEKTQRD